MQSYVSTLEQMEDQFQESGRGETQRRPPRSFSPRFDSRRPKTAASLHGAHRRHNKRAGV